jgi:hypothetical protein
VNISATINEKMLVDDGGVPLNFDKYLEGNDLMFNKLFRSIGFVRPDFRVHRYPKEQGYIYDAAAFRDILTRECARSDRNGHAFTLAVLNVTAGGEMHPDAAAIVELVGDRLRVTDQAGWLIKDTQLAIILYACGTDAARGFVERVQQDGHFDSLTYELFAYPEQLPEGFTKNGKETAHV